MSLKSIFVRLGILVIVMTGLIQSGIIDIESFNKTNEDVAPRTTKKQTSGSTSTTKVSDNAATSPQLPIDESQWELVMEKTCTIEKESPWNNKDFEEGWCLIGVFGPGKYRFEVQGGLKLIRNNGSVRDFPAKGTPLSVWRNAGDIPFAEFFEQWSVFGNENVGKIIFRINNSFPTAQWEVSFNKKSGLSASINFPQTEENWRKVKFHGDIVVGVFRKKT